jgi:hypothetical protein
MMFISVDFARTIATNDGNELGGPDAHAGLVQYSLRHPDIPARRVVIDVPNQ